MNQTPRQNKQKLQRAIRRLVKLERDLACGDSPRSTISEIRSIKRQRKYINNFLIDIFY